MKVTLRRRMRLSVVALLLTLWILPKVPVFAADKIVQLTVVVKEDDGKTPIPMARVNVYQENIAGSESLATVPDYGDDTNAQGIRRFDIKVKDGAELKLSIEVGREDKKGDRHDVNYGKNFPPQILQQFFLKSKATEAAEETTAVKVRVLRKDKNSPVEGAGVVVQTIGASGKGTGQTNANGEATVVLPRSTGYEVTASKELYGSAKQQVTSPKPQAELGPVELFLQREKGTELTITVTDDSNGSPVGDATVILDGPDYLRDTTSGGTVKFIVKEPGTYSVRISQQYYQQLNDQLTIAATDEKKTEPFQLTLKDKKEENKDKIEVTVLAKEDKESNAKPLPGAEVKAGRYTMGTDKNGRVTLTGSYNIREEVHVEAQGYKPQTKSVGLNKLMRYAAGHGEVTFTLEPLLSETDTVRIIVEVRDALGQPVKGAGVGFRLPDGTRLGGDLADGNGEVTFPAKDTPPKDPVTLRKGIEVVVQQPGYLEHTSLISSDLLKPSTQARRYSVQLNKDWSELEKALGGLEGRAAALKNEATAAAGKAKSVDAIVAKFPAVKGRVESILAELRKAQQVFDPKVVEKRCQEAAKLVEEIKGAQAEATKKEEGLKKGLDEAIGLAANCKSKAEGDVVKAKHRDAIKAAGEIGVLGKKAAEANGKLTRMAETMKDGRTLQTQLQQALEKIEGEMAAAKKDAASARAQVNDAIAANRAVPGKRAALVDELNKLKTKFEVQKNDAALPPELKTRLTNLEQLLTSILTPNPPELSRVEEVMDPILADLEQPAGEARSIVTGFKRAICTVQPMDDAVQEINSRVTGSTIELAAAAELPSKADACIANASQTPTPTPGSDEIIVPDVSGFADPGAMKAAAGPNMVGVIMATKATPTPGTTKLFAYQDPPANSKIKRGPPLPTLKIYIYQSLAAVSSPSPSPSASPGADEITVPDVSVYDDPGAMKAAAGPNMVGVIMATKATPTPGTTKLFAYQDPPANSKVKRGPPLPTLKIYIYQSLAQAATSPTPAGALTNDMPDLIGLTLEQAVARLPSNMRINSDEIGDKPPTPEKALTIFGQTPAPGTKFDPKKPPVVTVKRYGSAQATSTGKERFDGTYIGSYSGSDSGTIRFSVSGGTIAITSPGSGTGQISSSGSASISGSGADGESSYTFSGTFSVDANGKASAGGKWSGQQQGFKGRGSWSAAR